MTGRIYLFQGSSTLSSIAEVSGLFLVFILIVILSYYTSKWIGKSGAGMARKNHNITIVETLKLSQTKYLQIIKVTNKYIVIAVSKDQVEYLTEIDGEQLISIEGVTETPSFKEILSKIKQGTNVKSKENKDKDNEIDKNDV